MACNVSFVNRGYDLKSSRLHRKCPTVLEKSGNFGVFPELSGCFENNFGHFQNLCKFSKILLISVDIIKHS